MLKDDRMDLFPQSLMTCCNGHQHRNLDPAKFFIFSNDKKI